MKIYFKNMTEENVLAVSVSKNDDGDLFIRIDDERAGLYTVLPQRDSEQDSELKFVEVKPN